MLHVLGTDQLGVRSREVVEAEVAVPRNERKRYVISGDLKTLKYMRNSWTYLVFPEYVSKGTRVLRTFWTSGLNLNLSKPLWQLTPVLEP